MSARFLRQELAQIKRQRPSGGGDDVPLALRALLEPQEPALLHLLEQPGERGEAVVALVEVRLAADDGRLDRGGVHRRRGAGEDRRRRLAGDLRDDLLLLLLLPLLLLLLLV